MPNPHEQLAEMLMTFLKDKEAVISNILKNLSQANTIRRGLDRLLEQLEDEGTELDFRQVSTVLVKSMKSLSASAEQNGVLALLYVGGTNFDVDSALMMGKIGRGKEALQQMWKKKMEGR